MYYFSYSANISVAWFQTRVESAEPLDIYELHGYCLKFNKIGNDDDSYWYNLLKSWKIEKSYLLLNKKIKNKETSEIKKKTIKI